MLTIDEALCVYLYFEVFVGVFLTDFTIFVLVLILYTFPGVEDLSDDKLSRIRISLLFPIRLNEGLGVPGERDFFLTRTSFRFPIFLKGVFLVADELVSQRKLLFFSKLNYFKLFKNPANILL